MFRLRRNTGTRVEGGFGWRHGEDQPAVASVNCAQAEYVPEESTIAVGVAAIEDKMCAGNHRFDSDERYDMVGTTGFEPATSRTPSVRATRLRHVPTGTTALGPILSVSPAFEEGQDREQFLVEIEQEFAMCARRGAVLGRDRRQRQRFAVRVRR